MIREFVLISMWRTEHVCVCVCTHAHVCMSGVRVGEVRAKRVDHWWQATQKCKRDSTGLKQQQVEQKGEEEAELCVPEPS